jgi:iron complex outermembrane receptor protein
MRRLSPLFTQASIYVLSLAFVSIGAAAEKSARDLSDATLEDLMNIEVTTVGKKAQKISQSPAAVYVLTQEDIRRSGMNSVPELLRMVPGLQVAQTQGGQWAIGARGFNDAYSNKLLVLVDGRTVYSPIYSGVFWDEQDLLLQNIERIEVIRGPGATLWGANAVNGVINIITKPASETQGALATVGAGSGGQGLAGARWGGAMNGGHYRISTKYLHGRSLWDTAGLVDIDGQSVISAGMRADWAFSGGNSLTVKGDAIRSNADFALNRSALPPNQGEIPIGDLSGGSLMANWTRSRSDSSKTELQVYFSRTNRSEIATIHSSTIDVDFHHELALSESNAFVWGAGFRDSLLDTSGSSYVSFSPTSRNVPLLSAFAQNQWTIVPGRLALILGSKFEHNDFTGLEIQPGARILWTPDSRRTLWAATSRAVRAPAMLETNLVAHTGTLPGPGGLPIALESIGNPSLRSEDVLAYELGYRLQAKERFSVDLAGFHNVYTHLRTYEPGAPFFEVAPEPHLTVQTRYANLMRGETHGFEIASNWNVVERWRLVSSYSFLRLNMHPDTSSADPLAKDSVEGQGPRHQFQVRSNLDLSRKIQFDAAAYYTGALPYPGIAAYTRLDARLGYRPRQDFEISLSGQNLQGGRHAEFLSIGPYNKATIGRSVIVTLTWGL